MPQDGRSKVPPSGVKEPDSLGAHARPGPGGSSEGVVNSPASRRAHVIYQQLDYGHPFVARESYSAVPEDEVLVRVPSDPVSGWVADSPLVSLRDQVRYFRHTLDFQGTM